MEMILIFSVVLGGILTSQSSKFNGHFKIRLKRGLNPLTSIP